MKTVFNKLIDISLKITDGVHNTVVDDVDGDCFLLSAKNIKNGLVNFDNTDRRINNEVRAKLNKRTQMSVGDVLFTTVGTLGETALVDVNCNKYEFQRSVAIIKPNKNIIDNKYLYYLLKSSNYNYYFKSIATGAAQPCIFIGNLSKTKIEYFEDIEYQKRISNILSTYDDLIENNNRRIALLEKAAQELYKEWFVRFRFPGYETAEFENGIPKGWYVEKLGNLCNIITGKKDANQATGNGEYPFFTCARETTLFTDEYILDKNAILISGNGSYTGLVKKYSGKFDLYQRTYALYDFKAIEWLYVYWCMKINFEREFMGGSRGCAIPYITRPNIDKFKIVVPTQELLLKAQQIFENIHNECLLLESKNKNLIKQRDLLLPRLMSGKLEV